MAKTPCRSDQSHTLVAFASHDSWLTWQPLGDRVMGGQSDGTVDCAEDGTGIFHGTVRLDNGGGFASVKADLPEPFDAAHYTGIELLARGDGKTYKIGLRNSTDWRGKTITDAEPLDLEHLASVSLFVSGRQVGEFRLRMQDWRLIR